jgi:ribonuclease HI
LIICNNITIIINCSVAEKNNWKTTNGQDVSNKKLIKKIVKQLQNVDVEFVHVKGHAGCVGNEMADKLAYAASTAQLP